jgi:hypothetical protein
MTKYTHIETGSTDTREGWIDSYGDSELEDRGLTAEEAFGEDEGVTLIEVIDKTTLDLDEIAYDYAEGMEYDEGMETHLSDYFSDSLDAIQRCYPNLSRDEQAEMQRDLHRRVRDLLRQRTA